MPDVAVNYGELFADTIDNDRIGPIRDLTILAASGARGEIDELTIDVNVTGEGSGWLPEIVIEVAHAEPGRDPARPAIEVVDVLTPSGLHTSWKRERLAFVTLATTGPMDSGSWSQTFERADLRRYIRVRAKYRHVVWVCDDPRYRDFDGFVINSPSDPPRAVRRVQVIGTGTIAA